MPDHRRPQRKALPAKLACELVAEERADEPVITAKESDFDAAPPLPVEGHVRDDAVRVELRLVVAVGHVPEGRRHEKGRPDLHRTPERRVPPPGLEGAPLDEADRRADGLVVGAKGAGRARPAEQHLKRDRFGRRERHVDARAVFVRAVANAPEPKLRTGNISLEEAPELAGFHVTPEAEHRGAAPTPMARLAVFVVLARVVVAVVLGCASPSSVPVAAEIVHRGRCRGEIDDSRDHDATLLRRGRAARARGRPNAVPARPLRDLRATPYPPDWRPFTHVERLDRPRRSGTRA